MYTLSGSFKINTRIFNKLKGIHNMKNLFASIGDRQQKFLTDRKNQTVYYNLQLSKKKRKKKVFRCNII